MDGSCCDVRSHITQAVADCLAKRGGIKKVLLACKKFVTVTETDCTSNDAAVTDIVTTDIDLVTPAAAPLFYNVATKDKTPEYSWDRTYNKDSGGVVNGESGKFSVEVKNRATYCIMNGWVGQEVVMLFQERGTDRWYIVGRKGGFRVNKISGGTGTDTYTPHVFEFIGEDVDDIFIEVFITGVATTEVLIASITAL